MHAGGGRPESDAVSRSRYENIDTSERGRAHTAVRQPVDEHDAVGCSDTGHGSWRGAPVISQTTRATAPAAARTESHLTTTEPSMPAVQPARLRVRSDIERARRGAAGAQGRDHSAGVRARSGAGASARPAHPLLPRAAALCRAQVSMLTGSSAHADQEGLRPRSRPCRVRRRQASSDGTAPAFPRLRTDRPPGRRSSLRTPEEVYASSPQGHALTPRIHVSTAATPTSSTRVVARGGI